MKLYEIDNELRKLYESITEADGEITDEQLEMLNSLEIERDKKLEGYGVLIRELEGEIAECGEEIKRIKEIQDRKKKMAERLKTALQTFMANYEIPKFESLKVNISFRKSQILQIDDGAELTDEYIRVKEVREPNKEAIKDAIKHGIQFKGVYLLDKQNIQVK